MGARREDVPPPCFQPLGVFELAEFSGRVYQYIGVGPDSETPPGRLERPCVEYAVTEVGLGDGTEADNRLAGRDPDPFGRRGVSRVDQAPVGIKGLAVEEPLDRTPARPLQAILHLADLLGDVNMDGTGPGQGHDLPELVRGHCPEAVWGNSNNGPWQAGRRSAGRVQESGEPVKVGYESPLPWRRRVAAEVRV